VRNVRLTCEPLSAPKGTSDVLVRNDQGQLATTLWTHVAHWSSRDAELLVQILAPEPIALPAMEPSEPAPGAIARLTHALMGSGGLLLLRNPATAFGPTRIAFAQNVRMFAITTPEDEQTWDAMLSLGQPVYGVRGIVACACRTAHPGAVISALAYGTFTCEEGLAVSKLDESRHGVSWELPVTAETTVVVRDGYEADRIVGTQGSWQDRGSEGYVRLVMRSANGTAWTQPRFIAPVQNSGSNCG
jgi:hypothetical protein